MNIDFKTTELLKRGSVSFIRFIISGFDENHYHIKASMALRIEQVFIVRIVVWHKNCQLWTDRKGAISCYSNDNSAFNEYDFNR
ncbi:hypothetical protein ACU8V7_19080 [Zobellia nedashkovskayae]